MSLPLGLDPDLLRAFVFIAEEGNFTRAARRVGRTQSAISMQLQRLEARLGERLVARGKGGRVNLTAHGTFLLDRAREMLALNDAIWSSFRAPAIQGVVRLGSPDDYAFRYVPEILRRFAESHPSVQVEVTCLPSHALVERLRSGGLDLSLVSEGLVPDAAGELPSVRLWRAPLVWVTSTRYAPHRQDPLPLALAAEHCGWREAALQALEASGRRYRIAYHAGTQIGTQAPVLAGLAVTVATSSWLPEGLRVMRPDEGMPGLPDSGILMVTGRDARQPVTDALAAYIAETFRAGADRTGAEPDGAAAGTARVSPPLAA